MIVLGYFEEAFAGNAAFSSDVLEEWDHIIGTLRPAKRNVEDRVVVVRLLVPKAVGSSFHWEMLRHGCGFVSVPSNEIDLPQTV
jgi:hypothetical protein